MAQRLHPAARDAHLSRISKITLAVIAASAVSSAGLGAVIATAAPSPKTAGNDFGGTKAATPKPKGGDDKPESSSGDEASTSGGS
jgi:hypothetical protein